MEVIRYVTPCAVVDRMQCLGGTRYLLYLWRNSPSRAQAATYTTNKQTNTNSPSRAQAATYTTNKQTNKHTQKTNIQWDWNRRSQ
jgi:hypothetical protein